MPYITQRRRAFVDQQIDNLVQALGSSVYSIGDINYALTRILLGTVLADNPGYANFNEALGVLTAIQHEVYRRTVAPYEEAKNLENGDVF